METITFTPRLPPMQMRIHLFLKLFSLLLLVFQLLHFTTICMDLIQELLPQNPQVIMVGLGQHCGVNLVNNMIVVLMAGLKLLLHPFHQELIN